MALKLIKWTKALSVGMEDIDAQHRYFISLINRAYEIHDKKEKEKMSIELNDLISYARIHFTTEEKYFEQWDYPYKDEHMNEHAKLLAKLLKYSSDFNSGKCDCEDFLAFLKDWLENHLKTYDFKYAKYFKEHNLI